MIRLRAISGNADPLDSVRMGSGYGTSNEREGVTAKERYRATARTNRYLSSDKPCRDYADLLETLYREGKV